MQNDHPYGKYTNKCPTLGSCLQLTHFRRQNDHAIESLLISQQHYGVIKFSTIFAPHLESQCPNRINSKLNLLFEVYEEFSNVTDEDTLKIISETKIEDES